jgi:hypothetical protein
MLCSNQNKYRFTHNGTERMRIIALMFSIATGIITVRTASAQTPGATQSVENNNKSGIESHGARKETVQTEAGAQMQQKVHTTNKILYNGAIQKPNMMMPGALGKSGSKQRFMRPSKKA